MVLVAGGGVLRRRVIAMAKTTTATDTKIKIIVISFKSQTIAQHVIRTEISFPIFVDGAWAWMRIIVGTVRRASYSKQRIIRILLAGDVFIVRKGRQQRWGRHRC